MGVRSRKDKTMNNIPKDISKPMNPYAETDFDNAVDNALNELARKEAEAKKAEKAYLERCSMKSVADEMKKSIGNVVNEVVSEPNNSITLKYRATGEWLSMMRMLTENGYSFEVYPYPSLDEIDILWGDK